MILSAAIIEEMKDSAALLHISLHRENNLYGRLLGDMGKSLKEKNFLKLYMKVQTVVGHGFFWSPRIHNP